jgi:heat shock protein HtpX
LDQMLKFAILAACACGAWPVIAQQVSPTITVELHDDGSEEVTYQANPPVSAELWDAAAAAAGCPAGTHWAAGLSKLTCRHTVDRAGPIISATWDFAPLATALASSGAKTLTTCVYHPDWPYSVNNQNLPVQHIPQRTAYCGAWSLAGPPAPLQITVKAGYQPRSIQMLVLGSLLIVILLGGAGMLLRQQGFLLQNSLTTLWFLACFAWLGLLLWLDGFRMSSLWFGSTGNSRWLWAGLAASAPILVLAALFSLRDPRLQRWMKRRAPMAAALLVMVAVILCGAPQDAVLPLFVYGAAVLCFMVAVRTAPSGALLVAAENGELVANIQALANKANLPAPKLMLWHGVTNSDTLAAAVVGRRKLIVLSPNLLKLCSKREVDAIAAHELAHFRQRRRLILFVFVVLIGWILTWAAAVEQRFQFWAVLPAAACVLLFSAWKRSQEFVADRFSTSITGDPEAMAAALAKISAANRTPLRGSPLRELFMTHPWPEKRIRRLGASLDIGQRSPSLPAYAEVPSQRPVLGFAQTLAQFLPFILTRIWLTSILAAACAQWIPAPVVFLVAVAVGYFAIAALWSRRLRQAEAKVRAALLELHGPAWTDATLCGMSPGVGQTIFDVGYEWDIGLVRASGNSLCYAGDRASFALARGEVDRIELLPGPPIRWKPGKVIGLRLRAGTPESVTLSSRTNLFDSLRQWHASADAGMPLAGNLPSVTSVSWPKGLIVRQQVIGAGEFLRYLVAAAVPAWLMSCILWGWQLSLVSTLPPAVALALVCLFLGRGAVLKQDVLVTPQQEREMLSSSQSMR